MTLYLTGLIIGLIVLAALAITFAVKLRANTRRNRAERASELEATRNLSERLDLHLRASAIAKARADWDGLGDENGVRIIHQVQWRAHSFSYDVPTLATLKVAIATPGVPADAISMEILALLLERAGELAEHFEGDIFKDAVLTSYHDREIDCTVRALRTALLPIEQLEGWENA